MNFPWLTRGDRQHGLHSKALRPETGAEGGAQAGKREEKDSGPPPSAGVLGQRDGDKAGRRGREWRGQDHSAGPRLRSCWEDRPAPGGF